MKAFTVTRTITTRQQVVVNAPDRKEAVRAVENGNGVTVSSKSNTKDSVRVAR